MKEHLRFASPIGALLHEVERARNRDYAPLISSLWKRATDFALVTRVRAPGHDVTAPPDDERWARTAGALAPLRDQLARGLWVKEWPGTRSSGQSLWVQGPTRGTALIHDVQALWGGVFECSDLQLFEGEQLLFWVSSHEGFGEAWLSSTLAAKLGLPAKAATPKEYAVRGRRVLPEVWRILLGP